MCITNISRDCRRTAMLLLHLTVFLAEYKFWYCITLLLSTADKILTRVLLKRLVKYIADDNLPKSQFGFRAQRGTTCCIFMARHLQENCRKQNTHLYAVFFDLTKPLDTVNKNALLFLQSKLGCRNIKQVCQCGKSFP